MTIPANNDRDFLVEKMMLEFEERVGAKLSYCGKCHRAYYKHGKYNENLCVECSGTHETWNKEKYRDMQRAYARKNSRVRKPAQQCVSS